MSERVEWVVLDSAGDDFHVTPEFPSIPDFAMTWARAYCAGVNRNEDDRPYRLVKRTTTADGTTTEEPVNDA